MKTKIKPCGEYGNWQELAHKVNIDISDTYEGDTFFGIVPLDNG